MIAGVAVDSESNARDLLRGSVPPDQLIGRVCRGCGADLLVNAEHLANAARVYAQLGLPEPTCFLCAPCALEAEGRR
jgi:hypothetical protein